MKAAAALAVLLAGCVASSHEFDVLDSPGTRGPVRGSPQDVHTAAGDYVGYRVVRPCAMADADLGVRGTGSVVPTQAMIEAAGTELLQLVGDLWLPGGGGYGLACEAGVGTELMFGDGAMSIRRSRASGRGSSSEILRCRSRSGSAWPRRTDEWIRVPAPPSASW